MAYKKPIINSLFGIPNRLVLAVFAFLKSILDCLVMFKLGEVTWNAIDGYYVFNHFVFLATLLISLLFIWDVPFMIALLDGVVKNSSDLLKFTYSYSLTSLLTALGGASVCLYYVFNDNISLLHVFIKKPYTESADRLMHIAVITAYASIHILMIVLMKSEMIKINNVREEIKETLLGLH